MTEGRTVVAIRIPRPWTTEEDFLKNELETVSRTGILLLGTHSRPQGTILRFEVTLAGGEPLVRGEGRVVSYTPAAFRGEPGLLLRFTRLDARSKALVDRVAILRRQDTGSSPSAQVPTDTGASRTSEAPEAVSAATVTMGSEIGLLSSKMLAAAAPAPLPSDSQNIRSVSTEATTADARPDHVTDQEPIALGSIAPAQPQTQFPLGVATMIAPPFALSRPSVFHGPPPELAPLPPLTPPPDRDDLLARLRARAEALPPESRDAILAGRR